jgi:hypothetical protein
VQASINLEGGASPLFFGTCFHELLAKEAAPPFADVWASPLGQPPGRANIRCMSDHCIQVLTLVVQSLGILGLFIYCIETYKIRKASQNQVETSQKLIQASMDQVEGLSKPCVIFWAELRDGADAILEMHGAAGNLVARPDQGSYVIHNIGNGAALNLRYYMSRNNPDLDMPNARRWRYLPAVLATARATLVETLGGYNAEHEATFEYESLGGRKYRSIIALNHHVITAFRFGEVKG